MKLRNPDIRYNRLCRHLAGVRVVVLMARPLVIDLGRHSSDVHHLVNWLDFGENGAHGVGVGEDATKTVGFRSHSSSAIR
jgi:hypothetical protein